MGKLPYGKKPEQKERWNNYSNNYAHKNYKTITLKLNRNTDSDIIRFLESSDEGVTKLIKRLLRKELGGK